MIGYNDSRVQHDEHDEHNHNNNNNNNNHNNHNNHKKKGRHISNIITYVRNIQCI